MHDWAKYNEIIIEIHKARYRVKTYTRYLYMF